MGLLIAALKRKGGSCSSTMCANLATTWSKAGRSVRLMDCDPQRSLIAWAHMSEGEGMLSELVAEVATEQGTEFAAMLTDARDGYDRVIVDCAPGFDPLAIQAASVADIVVIPCRPSTLDVMAAADALEVAKLGTRGREGARIYFSPQANLPQTRMGRELPGTLAELGKESGATVLPSVSARIITAESPSSGLTCCEVEPDHPAAKEYAAVVEAIDADASAFAEKQ